MPVLATPGGLPGNVLGKTDSPRALKVSGLWPSSPGALAALMVGQLGRALERRAHPPHSTSTILVGKGLWNPLWGSALSSTKEALGKARVYW